MSLTRGCFCSLAVFLASLLAGPAAAQGGFVAHFDTGADGFEFVDDAFRGTNQPAYASGAWEPTEGFDGGGLGVTLGNLDRLTVVGMSGGWRRTFSLAAPAQVGVSLRVNLTLRKYESDQSGQAMVSLDGLSFGVPPNDYLVQLVGQRGGKDQSTGWLDFEVDLGLLQAGDHVLILGGHTNEKNSKNEVVKVVFDDVVLQALISAETDCKDGLDNDADGLVDCLDSDCSAAPVCLPETDCADGLDNDSDGFIDCLDSDCDGVSGCELGTELTCNDGLDNDSDGFIDCLDSDCDGVSGCELGTELTCNDGLDNDSDGFIDCLDSDCDGVAGCELGTEITCNDGLDNDADGLVDCLDSDCSAAPVCLPETDCADGLDNDSDGFIDCLDSDCAAAPVCLPETDCADGLDNDSDGFIDCLDSDCDGVAGCELGSELTCNDGLDNDADGLIDCLDADCVSAPECLP